MRKYIAYTGNRNGEWEPAYVQKGGNVGILGVALRAVRTSRGFRYVRVKDSETGLNHFYEILREGDKPAAKLLYDNPLDKL